MPPISRKLDTDKLCEIMFQTGLLIGLNPQRNVNQSMVEVDSVYSQNLSEEVTQQNLLRLMEQNLGRVESEPVEEISSFDQIMPNVYTNKNNVMELNNQGNIGNNV